MFPLLRHKTALIGSTRYLGFYEIRRPRKNLHPMKVVLRLPNYDQPSLTQSYGNTDVRI